MVKVIAAFSPKGGSGTSLIVANLAIYLAQKGKKVLLMDAAPNRGTLHAYLNLPSIAVTDEVAEHFTILPLITTNYQNLSFFSNLRKSNHLGKVSEYLVKWQTEIKQSNFDFLFIDMGSDIDDDLMEVIGIVDYSLMFFFPDFVSFEKSNRFFNEFVNYRLKNLEQKYDISFATQNLRRNKKDLLFTYRNLLLMLAHATPKNADQIADIVNEVKLGFVFNSIRTSQEKESASTYPFIIKHSFGVEADYIGEFAFSDIAATSIASMKPVVTLEKNGEFVNALDNLASSLSQCLFQKKAEQTQKKSKLVPFNYYELFGLDRGCSTLDINNQYYKLKKLFVYDNPMLRDLYEDRELFILNALFDDVFKELNDLEIRREYDMEMEAHLTSLEDSFPDAFILSEVIKKYNRVKKNMNALVKKDVFGRNVEKKSTVIEDLDFVDSNAIFEKYKEKEATGKILKKIREETGISTKSIASSTKISHFVINAIENDNYLQLPADIYVKAFLKQYCAAIKLNGENSAKVVADFLKAKNAAMNHTAENFNNIQ